MQPFLRSALCASAVIALAACQSSNDNDNDNASAPAPAAAQTAPAIPPSHPDLSPSNAPASTAAPASAGTPAASLGEDHPTARDACLAAVARETNLDVAQLKVTDVAAAEAGVGVTIMVPGAQAPWTCLSDDQGHVQGARYMGDEGKM